MGPVPRSGVAFARRAEALAGAPDAKLAALDAVVQTQLSESYDPVVFCRFIDTAEHLRTSLGRSASVVAVTGALPPGEREARIAELTATPGRHVLVATDCLSEGVNLQEHFQAVIHYDLAWNPTRHEQREGRVDRFSQTYDSVRAVTIIGADNSGTGMKYFLTKQLACPTPATFVEPTPWQPDRTLAQWVIPYVRELSYTSWRLQPYAREMGDTGPPFRWDPERRSLLRADLDAALLHVYGLTRREVEHVLDSFPVVHKYDGRDHGEYRTRRLVLDAYDRMATATVRGGAGWSPLADVPAGVGRATPPS